jgi:hypothetical protein
MAQRRWHGADRGGAGGDRWTVVPRDSQAGFEAKFTNLTLPIRVPAWPENDALPRQGV